MTEIWMLLGILIGMMILARFIMHAMGLRSGEIGRPSFPFDGT